MYLRTPKRYTEKGKRRSLINLHWLWLYILTPVVLIPALILWDYRDEIRPIVGQMIPTIVINPPTPTATIPPKDYAQLMSNAFQVGDINTAITLLKGFTMDVAPNDVTLNTLLAQLIVLRAYGGDPVKLADALTAAQRAINANPEVADGWITMALVLDWSGKPQEGLPYALRAKDLDEKSLMVQAVLAEIYHDLEKDDLATKLIDDAIKVAKSDPQVNRAALSHAYYVKGLIESNSDGKAAIAQYENAWRIAISDPPDNTIAAGYIAQPLSTFYRNNQQADKAITMLAKAIERDKNDPLLQLELGRSYVNKGDYEKGRTYVEACLDVAPNEIKCLRWLGIFAYQNQNYTKSIDYMQKIINLDPKNAEAYLYLGRDYGALNQCSTAVTSLETGLPFVTDPKMRSDYEDALRACGATSGLNVSAETPTPDPNDANDAAVATDAPTPPAAQPAHTPTPNQ
ncbi:MAG: tetratricopeptide repeat protein [Anaerolineae bacterium]|nr:tetratricopeptide repeat protein [Anaerolineae bacterium]